MRFTFVSAGLLCGALATSAVASTLIRNVKLIDGSGQPSSAGALRIDDQGKIADVGKLEPTAGETIVDGHGLALAPGFIDAHSHHDWKMAERRTVDEQISQGVTTIVVGQDGSSVLPLSALWTKLAATPVSVNVASYSGHNSIRRAVMGADYKRLATPQEITAMQALLRTDMQAGAFGLSTGLAYDPGLYSNPDEVVELSRASAEFGGRYISHMRRENITGIWAAVDELLRVGRETGQPVQISHIKMGGTSLYGKADEMLAKLAAARAEGIKVTFDIYPYEYWQSTMTVLLPKRDFNDYAEAKFALTELTTPDGVTFSKFDADPSIVGKTLAQVAAERKADPIALYLELIRESLAKKTTEAIIGVSMRNDDIAKLIQSPLACICSDGEMSSLHPRGAGSFAKIFRVYVREQKVLSLEEAVHKMTGATSDNLGFKDRGYLKTGYAADLVLFDPAVISDKATMENAAARAVGVSIVWVNGQVVFHDGKATGVFAGQTIKRAPSAPKS